MPPLTIISQGEGHAVSAFYNHLQANCGALSTTLAESDLVSVSTVSVKTEQMPPGTSGREGCKIKMKEFFTVPQKIIQSWVGSSLLSVTLFHAYIMLVYTRVAFLFKTPKSCRFVAPYWHPKSHRKCRQACDLPHSHPSNLLMHTLELFKIVCICVTHLSVWHPRLRTQSNEPFKISLMPSQVNTVSAS